MFIAGQFARRKTGVFLAATLTLSASYVSAWAFSADASKPAPAVKAHGPEANPLQFALDAPSGNGTSIPMPDPLVNKQAASDKDAGSKGKSVEYIFDINKAPEPVRKLREAIVEAAASGDPERLRPLLGTGANQTQLTADDPTEDPIKVLHDLSGDQEGIEVLSILLDILSTGFAHIGQGTPDEMYVWPYFAEKDIKTLTPPEKVDLMRIITAGDYSDMLEFGGYNFYRIGITPDGKWKYFTSGE